MQDTCNSSNDRKWLTVKHAMNESQVSEMQSLALSNAQFSRNASDAHIRS